MNELTKEQQTNKRRKMTKTAWWQQQQQQHWWRLRQIRWQKQCWRWWKWWHQQQQPDWLTNKTSINLVRYDSDGDGKVNGGAGVMGQPVGQATWQPGGTDLKSVTAEMNGMTWWMHRHRDQWFISLSLSDKFINPALFKKGTQKNANDPKFVVMTRSFFCWVLNY